MNKIHKYHKPQKGDQVYAWSWNLTPEPENYPNGTINFSDIDKTFLKMNFYSKGSDYPDQTIDDYNGCQACFDLSKKQGFTNITLIGNGNHIGIYDDIICFGKKGTLDLKKINFWIQRKAVKLIKKWWKRWFFINGILKIGKISLMAKESWKNHVKSLT